MPIMKDVIEKLQKTIEESKLKIELCEQGISCLQKICNHTNEDGTDAYIRVGNDSHYVYYECSICKAMAKE